MARYAGFDWHLVKPGNPAALLGLLKDPTQPQPRRPGVVRLA